MNLLDFRTILLDGGGKFFRALLYYNVRFIFLEMTNRMLTVAEQLPPSARAIYTLLSEQGPLTSKDLIQKCDLAPRTVRYALKRLTKEGLVKKAPYLLDMRSSKYFVETG